MHDWEDGARVRIQQVQSKELVTRGLFLDHSLAGWIWAMQPAWLSLVFETLKMARRGANEKTAQRLLESLRDCSKP